MRKGSEANLSPRDAWRPVAHRRIAKRAAERALASDPGDALMKRITAYVRVEEWKAFKTGCVDENRSMSDVVSELVVEWVKARAARNRPKRGARP